MIKKIFFIAGTMLLANSHFALADAPAVCPGTLVATCESSDPATLTIYRVDSSKNSFCLAIRDKHGDMKPFMSDMAEFSEDGKTLKVAFAVLGFTIPEGKQVEGTLSGLLVPDEKIICDANWESAPVLR